MSKLVPSIIWAQRRPVVYVTIALSDLQEDKIDLQPTKIHFSGTMKGKLYEIEFEPYDEIVPEKSLIHKTDYHLQMTLAKKNAGTSYWPHLLKQKGSHHWLKVDFNKWMEEEDEEEAPDDVMPNLEV